jgi:hypothetical protein
MKIYFFTVSILQLFVVFILSSVPKTLPFRGGMKGTKYFKFFEKCNFLLGICTNNCYFLKRLL